MTLISHLKFKLRYGAGWSFRSCVSDLAMSIFRCRSSSPAIEDFERPESVFKKKRRSSSVSAKSIKFEDDDIDDEIFTGSDALPLEPLPMSPLVAAQNEWPAENRDKGTRVLTPIPRYFLPPEYFVYASPGAIVADIHNMCIVTPGQDLTKIPVPESLREMVLARFDRLPPLEKVVLKCSSILGDCFPSDLVAAIVPKSAAAQVDLALYHLLKVCFTRFFLRGGGGGELGAEKP